MKQKAIKALNQELENFQRIAKVLEPPKSEIPELENIDIYGESIPLSGSVGGDHIIYIDFKKRYDLESRIERARKRGQTDVEKNLRFNMIRAGVLIVDVSGHSITDAYLTGRLHDAFLTGMLYELDTYGQVTTRLFETLNTRFYDSSSIEKFLTMIYGEISEEGKFRFISAGHPPPVIFSSKYDKILDISQERMTHFPPLGMLPSETDIDKKLHFSYLGYKENYRINQINLMGSGDILLLYTDGLSDHSKGNEEYFPHRLESILLKIKRRSAQEIYYEIKADIMKFGPQTDDVSYIVIKKK